MKMSPASVGHVATTTTPSDVTTTTLISVAPINTTGNVLQYYTTNYTNFPTESSTTLTFFNSPGVGVLLTLFTFITIFGNTLVIVAVFKVSFLRSVNNYLYVSLAAADLLMGFIVMPFSVIQLMSPEYWYFTQVWCDMWHACDVLGSTASILNLCIISLDRYWAITDPLGYTGRMSVKRACGMIAMVWACSSLISFPAIVWWRAVDPNNQTDSICEFTEDPFYLICSSLISFYIPLVIMLFTYFQVYQAAESRSKCLKLGQIPGQSSNGVTLRIHRGKASSSDSASEDCSDSGTINHISGGSKKLLVVQMKKNNSIEHKTQMMSTNRRSFSNMKTAVTKFTKERKAARTLGIVMGAFIACWLPFFLLNVIAPLCIDCIPRLELVIPSVTWLGYLNSGFNPIIYAFSNREFKLGFYKVLCRKQYRRWNNRRTLMRCGTLKSQKQQSVSCV